MDFYSGLVSLSQQKLEKRSSLFLTPNSIIGPFFAHSVQIKLALPQAAQLRLYIILFAGKLKISRIAPPRGTC